MKDVANTFKALADITRLRILMLLFNGELCVCEVIAALQLPQSTISRHLAYLKKTGWVEDRKEGVWMYYRLNRNEVCLRQAMIEALQNSLADDPDIRTSFDRLEIFRRDHLQKSA